MPLCRNIWTLPIRHACNLNWTVKCTCFTIHCYFLKTISFAPDPRNRFEPTLSTWSNIVVHILQSSNRIFYIFCIKKTTTSFFVPSINLRNDSVLILWPNISVGCRSINQRMFHIFTFENVNGKKKHFDEMFDGHFKAICLYLFRNPKIRRKEQSIFFG